MNANDSNDREMERLLEGAFHLRAQTTYLPHRTCGYFWKAGWETRPPSLCWQGSAIGRFRQEDSVGCRRLRPRQRRWWS